MKTSFSKVTALIVLLLVIIGLGVWLLMRSVGTSSAPAQAETGGRRVLYYKSTMMLGEISQTSRKARYIAASAQSAGLNSTRRPSPK